NAGYQKELAARHAGIYGSLLDGKLTGEAAKVSGVAVDSYEKLHQQFGPTFALPLQGEYARRADTLLRLARHEEAAAAAGKMAPLTPDRWHGYLQAARLLSRCAAAAQKDERLGAHERLQATTGYTDRALQLLEDAVAKGFTDTELLRRDEAF